MKSSPSKSSLVKSPQGQFPTAHQIDKTDVLQSQGNTQEVPDSDTGLEPVRDAEAGQRRNECVSDGLKHEKLAYLAEMLGELRQLCMGMDERMIAYLMEMALIETNTALGQFDFESELGRALMIQRKVDRKTG